MKKRVKVYANFEEALDPEIWVESEKDIEIVIDYLIPSILPLPIPENTIRFAMNIQPEGEFLPFLLRYQVNYNYLLTFIPSNLNLPKAVFFICLTPFCKSDVSTNKEFGVSSVFSLRNCLPGHKLRHELWRRQNEITIPRYFYAGSRTGMNGELILPAEKCAKQLTMNTMYHIAIDSYDYENSFSEKLIDPLLTLTMPIYWGAKNIHEYFDMEGIIRVNSVDEIIDICNKLTPDFYYEKMESLLTNYHIAISYQNFAKRLEKKLQEIINHHENT